MTMDEKFLKKCPKNVLKSVTKMCEKMCPKKLDILGAIAISDVLFNLINHHHCVNFPYNQDNWFYINCISFFQSRTILKDLAKTVNIVFEFPFPYFVLFQFQIKTAADEKHVNIGKLTNTDLI